MTAYYHQLEIETGKGFALHDITSGINEWLTAIGVENGLLTVTSLHTTCALTVNENESRLLDDIRQNFWRLMPPGQHYLHNDIHLRACPQDEPENAHAHLIAMLLGNSETLAVQAGQLVLGRWQSVLLVEIDGPRQRSVALHCLGS